MVGGYRHLFLLRLTGTTVNNLRAGLSIVEPSALVLSYSQGGLRARLGLDSEIAHYGLDGQYC